MINFVMVWVLEYIAVITLNSAFAITAVSVICHIAIIMMMMGVVSSAIHVPVFKLLPVKELLVLFFSCAVTGFISWYVIRLMPFAHIKIASLAVGFMIFAVLTFVISKPLKIDYLDVVRPLLNKFIKK